MATNPVWADISSYLENKISKSALHTLVFKGRYEIKEKLGLSSYSKPIVPNVVMNSQNESG